MLFTSRLRLPPALYRMILKTALGTLVRLHPTSRVYLPLPGCVYKGNGPRGGRRVIRGGSWGNGPEDLRALTRYRGDAVYRYNAIGFRLAAATCWISDVGSRDDRRVARDFRGRQKLIVAMIVSE